MVGYRLDGARDMEMTMTLYATAEPEDLDDDGTGRIRILAEFNEPSSEIDIVGYPADEDEARATANIHQALIEAGYQPAIGSTIAAIGGVIVPVKRLAAGT